jgi:protein SCO1/2
VNIRTVIMLVCAAVAAPMQATDAPPSFVTPWIDAARRTPLHALDVSFKDHDGRDGVLRDLIDRPVLITFFYTRCQNSRKCSMAVSRLAMLQRQLAEAGLAGSVRLLAITYEPQFDTPARMNRFATDRGFALGENALALELDTRRNQRVVEELQAPANYNAGWINTHGIELSLLDGRGRVVRKYQTLLWNNDQVVEDLRRVLAER